MNSKSSVKPANVTHPGGSLLVKTDVIHGPSEVNQGKTHSSAPMGENAQTSQIRCLSPHVKPTCVEIVQSSLEEKGFCTKASWRIMVPQALSTQKVYASKWKIFENWRLSKDLDPFKATIPQIADFLLYPFHKKMLAF